MAVWVVVPIKPLNRAKSRLATILAPHQRESLALGMLRHTLTVLSQTPLVKGVLVVSRDMKALSVAREFDEVQTLQESGTPELNATLRRASKMLRAWGAGASLILPADIPLISREEVEAIIHRGVESYTVVITPDRHENGTNAIFSRPLDLIPLEFGDGSFARHLEQAQQQQVDMVIYHSVRLGLDIDTPDDLEAYHQLAAQVDEPLIEYEGVES